MEVKSASDVLSGWQIGGKSEVIFDRLSKSSRSSTDSGNSYSSSSYVKIINIE